MTYSIVALDPATGDLGVAVQSKFLAVGAVVPWAQAGVGAVATQSFANVAFGPGGLARMASGMSAGQALERLINADPLRAQRQVGLVDAHGGAATHTGAQCFAWAGGLTGPGFAAQGNILAGASVVDGLVDTLVGGGLPFPELLVACLVAADAQGGDRRGRESASLLVVRAGGGYGGANDRWVDLRVDHDDDPIGKLGALLDLQRLYLDRPTASELVPIDATLAAECRSLLTNVGAQPGGRFGNVYQPMDPAAAATAGAAEDAGERPMTGTPVAMPSNWDDEWQQALWDWQGVENLEERTAAPGLIDPRVLAVLRAKARAA
jgi:uncharacterized Ntn-hydrolase superfamily protein